MSLASTRNAKIHTFTIRSPFNDHISHTSIKRKMAKLSVPLSPIKKPILFTNIPQRPQPFLPKLQIDKAKAAQVKSAQLTDNSSELSNPSPVYKPNSNMEITRCIKDKISDYISSMANQSLPTYPAIFSAIKEIICDYKYKDPSLKKQLNTISKYSAQLKNALDNDCFPAHKLMVENKLLKAKLIKKQNKIREYKKHHDQTLTGKPKLFTNLGTLSEFTDYLENYINSPNSARSDTEIILNDKNNL